MIICKFGLDGRPNLRFWVYNVLIFNQEFAAMDELINKYTDIFGENFPFFMCMGISEDEVTAIILECLRTNTPFHPEIIEDAVY